MGVATLFVFVDEDGQQLGEFLFFRSRFFALVEAQQFIGEAGVLLAGANDVRERAAEKLAVGFFVEIDGGGHCFKAVNHFRK